MCSPSYKSSFNGETSKLLRTRGRREFIDEGPIEVWEYDNGGVISFNSNENTKKKTLYDIKVFKEYLDACDEKREIEDIITPVELQAKKLKITVSDDSSPSQ